MSVIYSIVKHEGFEPKPYIDPLAKQRIPADEFAIIEKHWASLVPTFGHGLTYITEEESQQIVKNRVQKIQHSLKTRIPGYFNFPHQVRDVLIEMSFQMGVDGVLKFKKTIAALQSDDFDTAADEMLDSRWAKQTPSRAIYLADIVRDYAE